MDKHRPSEEMLRELDNLLSRLNAMEIVASEDQKSHVRVMRTLVEGQMHSIREFDHLKKALDLLTEQIFKVQDRINRP